MTLENKVCNLEGKVKELSGSVEELTKQVQELVSRLPKEETTETKVMDLREMICRVVIDGIYSYFYQTIYQDFGGKGHDTTEQAIYLANDLIARVGIVSVQTENYDKAFIYALNPYLLIDHDKGKLWDFLCDRVKNYHYHMLLAIGIYKFGDGDEDDFYGKYMNILAREYCEKQDEKLRQLEDS